MSESIVTESIVNTADPAPVSAHNSMQAGASDLRMLAQVEKWIAMIREIRAAEPTGFPALKAMAGTMAAPPLTK